MKAIKRVISWTVIVVLCCVVCFLAALLVLLVTGNDIGFSAVYVLGSTFLAMHFGAFD